MSSDSTSDTNYVHARFYDSTRFETVRNVKRDHDATWREIIEFGARYLEILDAVTKVQTDDAIKHLLTDAQETQPELIEDADVDDDFFGTLYRDDATQSHGDRPSSPKRDPDTPDSRP